MKLWGLRWWMMGVLMLRSVINYLTRATLAVAAPSVLEDLDRPAQNRFAGIVLQEYSAAERRLVGARHNYDWFEYHEREYAGDVSRLEMP